MEPKRAGGARRTVRGLAALRLIAVVVTAAAALVAPAANAAAGSPFDPSTQQIFTSKSASQTDPTGLYSVSPNSGGTYTFTQIGSDSDLVYNALTFNPLDNYLYAITGDGKSSGVPAHSLIKIGANGGYSVVGSAQFPDPDSASAQIYLGAVNPKTGVFYVMNGDPNGLGNATSQLARININPSSAGYGTAAGAPVTLSTGWDNVARGSDFAYSQGYLWALGDTSLSRIDPATGAVATFPVPTGADSSAGDQAGAAWTFADGDLGFSYNQSGLVIRIRVTNASAASPGITTVLSSGGSGSGQNDGAAIPGTVDLSITKAAVKIDQNKRARWTMVVTNNGGNPSAGWTVTDNVPAGFTKIAVAGGTSSSVSGQKVTVKGGALAVGATATITVEATAPANPDPTVTNTARVVGDDPDAVSSNNVASAELTYSTSTGSGSVPGAPATGTPPAAGGPGPLTLAGLGLLGVAVVGGLVGAMRRQRTAA
jgi:uncharacterized repeat protein (TIGR01451 family)